MSAVRSSGCLGPVYAAKRLGAAVRRLVGRAPKVSKEIRSTTLVHVRSFNTVVEAPHGRGPCPLPLDVWGVVAAFLPSDVLCAVSGTFWRHLPRYDARFLATTKSLPSIAAAYAVDSRIRSLRLDCRTLDDKTGKQMAFVSSLPALETLRVDLNLHRFGNHAAERTVRGLATVYRCPRLRRLEFSLNCNRTGHGHGCLNDEAAAALSRLGTCRSLETLSLDLGRNNLTGSGVERLATGLAALSNLTKLELGLSGVDVGNAGASALAGWVTRASLTALTLNLEGAVITEGVSARLADIVGTRGLRSLKLDLSGTALRDAGLQAILQAAGKAPLLEVLALNVMDTAVTHRGLTSVSCLAGAPCLQEVTFLCGSAATDAVAQAVGDLRLARCLRSLTFAAGRSEIGDEGAKALALLRNAPTLRSLVLSLDGTGMTDAGARALATLAFGRALDALTLNVTDTLIGIHGRVALTRLRATRQWESLVVLCPHVARNPKTNHIHPTPSL